MPPEQVQSAGYCSQWGQDVLLDRHVFAGMCRGVFADVGAYDGVTYSNSYYLEQQRGWSGVCIEANPDVFAACAAARSSLCVHAAIIDGDSDTAEFMVAPGGAVMLSGLTASMDARHARRIERDAGVNVPGRTVVVPSRRLSVVLTDADITRIDLLLVDVEGGECGVLRSIDLAAFGMPVVLVENNYGEYKIASMMRRASYRLVGRIGRDELYVPADSRRLIRFM